MPRPGATTHRTSLFCSLLFVLALFAADDEIVKEFKKYFRKYKDSASRVEAVLSLEGTESIKVVDVLLPVLKDKDLEVARAAIQVLGAFETAAPIERIYLQLDKKKDSAVRAGLLQAMTLGAYPGGDEALQSCLKDKDWDVRRRAVQALASRRDPVAVPFILPLVDDGEAAVRCAALEGLAALRAPEVVSLAIKALAHPVWQVRSSAIDALGTVRHLDSVGPLIERMAREEGRLQADIGAALGEITGRTFGQRLDGWQRFWKSYGDRFQIPTDAELARLRAKQKERLDEYNPPGAVTFHGITTPSRSILFVIDVSGSMENLVVDRERFQDGDYPSMRRMDIVKTELARTIDGLESYVRFNVLAFATDIRSWKKKLVVANVLNKSSSSDFARKLEALGGSSKSELAGVGLRGSANLEAGRTNTYAALMRALGADGKSYRVEVDTIFFLSDGRPSYGKFVETDDILREVRLANELRKVVIHTIAIGEFQKDFMRRLAVESGGVFVDLGR